MNHLIKIILFASVFVCISQNAFAEEKSQRITMMTENAPPNAMITEQGLQGLAVDILDAMLQLMGTEEDRGDIIVSNWSRAYSMAKNKKNHMVFSTLRTPEREPFFKWVGPISTLTVGIIAPKSKNIVIEQLSDFGQYRVGAVLKDIGGRMLVELGVKEERLQYVSGKNATDLSFKKLNNNRIDLFAYPVEPAMYAAKVKGHDVSKFEVVYVLNEGDTYYAFNKNTDDDIITQWQVALDTLKENGAYNKIIEKY